MIAPAEECAIDPDRLGARYTVTQVITSDGNRQEAERHVQIWRHGNQVAYVREEEQVTEIWDLVVDGRQKLIRYFDAHQRAIEYQPGDLGPANGGESWSRRYHIVSDAERAAMTRAGSSGEGCDEVIRFEHVDVATGARDEMEWDAGARVVKSLVRTRGIEQTTWTLDTLYSDGERVDEEFVRRHRYRTVDFVDIGDNESDPFLRDMMHLGFSGDHDGH